MRCAVYGFHQASLAAAVDQLTREGHWQVVYWAGSGSERTFDDDIVQWHLGNFPKRPRGDDNRDNNPDKVSANSPDSDRAVSAFCQELDDNRREQFADQLSRHPFATRWTPAQTKHFLPELLSYFLYRLKVTQAQFLLLQNLPHQAFDLALYWAAQILQLPTTLCYQSILPHRFFFCHQLEDFGWFRQVAELPADALPTLPVGFEKELFYMSGVATGDALHNPQGWGSWKRRWRDLKLEWKFWKQQVGWYRWIGKPHGFNVDPEEQFHWNLRRAAIDWPTWIKRNSSTEYVYFPLHLQPELTSSTLGDQYRDQLSAIEAICEWLPPGVKVVVKENPKQTHRYRDQSFFERLQKLPQVVFIGKQGNTYDLMRGAALIATLSGTVGWEAITGGKNVLVFGRPWYLNLPGVYHWSQQPAWEQITRQPIDRNELAAKFAGLCALSRLGVVDLNYAAALPDFSPEQNQARLAIFLREQTLWATSNR